MKNRCLLAKVCLVVALTGVGVLLNPPRIYSQEVGRPVVLVAAGEYTHFENTTRVVSYLGRKSLAFARSHHWLQARLHWFIHYWNLRQAKKYA